MSHLSPLERYQADLTERGFRSDPAQQEAVARLDDLYQRLIAATQVKRSAWRRIFGAERREAECGLYLWGGVGRGKTYLMDLFYDALPFEDKLRTHFHRFMRSVHHELKALDAQSDPLEIIAAKFAKQYRIICFDEFFVVDITDAMILARLLEGLFRRGVTLVTTSNIEPSGLYKDGLQRARFLPAIALLEEHTEVLNVDGGVDYRLRALKQSPIYFHPLGEDADAAMGACFERLVAGSEHRQDGGTIEVEGRSITVRAVADDTLWCDFLALCDGPRSQNDYIELAREFHTVLVSGVPLFSERNDDQARRFIYLVDEFYDRQVKLLLSAAAPYTQLYTQGRLAFEFERTQSRLQEMQSEAYLGAEHRG